MFERAGMWPATAQMFLKIVRICLLYRIFLSRSSHINALPVLYCTGLCWMFFVRVFWWFVLCVTFCDVSGAKSHPKWRPKVIKVEKNRTPSASPKIHQKSQEHIMIFRLPGPCWKSFPSRREHDFRKISLF